ncbi:DsbA family protein [Patescibacteria group bacterium]|nr:DsbA family protein [Patescibacteria group bacterium]
MEEELNSSSTIPTPATKKKRWYKKWWGITIIVFILLTAIFVLIVAYQVYVLVNGSNNRTSEAKVYDVSVDDDPYLGSPNAKVTIIAFEDFECPFCADAYPIIREIASTYGDQIQFVYRDYPIPDLHPSAQKAHEAGECADDQGKFWLMHDKLFQNQDKLAISDLKQYAMEIGLNTNAFGTCLDSGRFANEIEKDRTDGIVVDVRGTPTWFINGIKIEGIIPLDAFKEIIEIYLAN